jgi:hypothetical protein
MAVGDDFYIGPPLPEDPTSGIADKLVIVAWDKLTKVDFPEPAVSA